MKEIPETLAQRRERLVARCHAQRLELAVQRQYLQQSMGTIYGVAQFVERICKNPLLLAGAALGVVVIRPRRIFSLLASITMAWQAWQRVAPIIAPFLKRRLN